MSGDDVHPYEMDETPDLDDGTADALLAGGGSDVEPRLADLLGDIKVAYASNPPAVGADLAAFIGAGESAVPAGPRRFERARASMLAKCGAAIAVVVAGTSGLAVAGALPRPVQNAFSTVGIGAPHHHAESGETKSPVESSTSTSIDGSSTETTAPGESNTPTTVNHPDNKGGDIAGIAQDDNNQGCEHGHTVAAVASGGASQGNDCKSTGTVPQGTTPTSISGGQGQGVGNGSGQTKNDQGKHDNGNHNGSDNGHEGAGETNTSPTTVPHDNGKHKGANQGSVGNGQ